MKLQGLAILMAIIVAFLLLSAGILAHHAWNLLQVRPVWEKIQQANSPQDLLVWIDSQIDDARLKVSRLEPGPPPPWYAPRYYYEWLPKEKLYGEAQETLSRLQKQRLAVVERGTAAMRGGRVVWNAGIAPLLHLLLSVTLMLAGTRIALRMMLIRRQFGWVRL